MFEERQRPSKPSERTFVIKSYDLEMPESVVVMKFMKVDIIALLKMHIIIIRYNRTLLRYVDNCWSELLALNSVDCKIHCMQSTS